MHAVHLHLVIWQTLSKNMIYKQGKHTAAAQNIQWAVYFYCFYHYWNFHSGINEVSMHLSIHH